MESKEKKEEEEKKETFPSFDFPLMVPHLELDVFIWEMNADENISLVTQDFRSFSILIEASRFKHP